MAANRILRNLKETKQQNIVCRMCKSGVSVCAFSDANWVGELTSRKSTSGVRVKLNSMSACVCWTNKLQASVALPTKPLGTMKTALFTKLLLCLWYSSKKGGVSTYDSFMQILDYLFH